jgi:pyrrolidone-carboxylate peptidase
LMYQVAAEESGLRSSDRIPFIFMHSPCSPESVSDPVSFMESGKVIMSVEDIVRGLEILLEHSLLAR